MKPQLALRGFSADTSSARHPLAQSPSQSRREFAAALWTAVCLAVALSLLFAFFFRMEESVAQQLDASPDAEWAQRHWQCSAVPVMKQAACEAHLERMRQIETAHAGPLAR